LSVKLLPEIRDLEVEEIGNHSVSKLKLVVELHRKWERREER
jgi:hypothetical protein